MEEEAAEKNRIIAQLEDEKRKIEQDVQSLKVARANQSSLLIQLDNNPKHTIAHPYVHVSLLRRQTNAGD